jgi:hypothetical protein
MRCYVCCWYVFVAIYGQFRYKSINIQFRLYIDRTLYLLEQGCVDPRVFFEAKRRPRQKISETLYWTI